jgi:transposase-like protein
MITKAEKESIITEKLTSRISYRDLAKKHNSCFQTLHQWVNAYQGKMRNRQKTKKDSVSPLPNLCNGFVIRDDIFCFIIVFHFVFYFC